MACIRFITKKSGNAMCQLIGSMVLGRSLDCDILVPDVFVSRRHCRIEPSDDGWVVVDLGAANGIFVGGRRVSRHLMSDGDVFEVGTIAVEFRDTEASSLASSRTPFGPGTWVTELVDTIYAGGKRPAEFTKQTCRRHLWAAKAGGEDLVRLEDDLDDGVEIVPPGRFSQEWAELDVEWQVFDGTMHAPAVDVDPYGEWTDLDLDLQYLAVKPAATRKDAATPAGRPSPFIRGGGHLPPRGQANQDDDGDCLLTLEDIQEPVRQSPQPTPPLGRMSLWDKALAEEAEQEEADRVAAQTRALARRPSSLAERLQDRMADMRDSDAVQSATRNPRWWVGIAALLAVLFFSGSWAHKRINRPPLILSDGKPNPAYNNGADDHS